MTEERAELERPDYRYLEPLPGNVTGRWAAGVRWALVVAGLLWVLILLAGFLIARST